MAEVLLLHHAQGRTEGVVALADRLRAPGHVVHVPDLLAGRTFDTLDAAMAHLADVGAETVVQRALDVADGLPAELVYVGASLGAMPAMALAQRRPGARGVVLLHGGVPLSLYGGRWPSGLPLQMHVMAEDDWGDVEVLHELAEQTGGSLHLYPGSDHLFTDASLPVHDRAATDEVVARVLDFLDEVDARG